MIRATTGGVLKVYRSNLMKSFNSVNQNRDTVLTQRVFNSYAEDPAAAAKAFQLRKARMSVESQYDICNGTYRKFQTGWSCLDTISKLIDTDTGTALSTMKGIDLQMLNDPMGDARDTLAKALDQVSETIVQTLNQKYGDNFIFAGADGQNVPFQVIDNKLYYRNVPVDAAKPEVLTNAQGAPVSVNQNGVYTTSGSYYLQTAKTTIISKADYDKAVADQKTDPTVEIPNVLKGTDGKPVLINKNGQYDPAGDRYLCVEDAKVITAADYKQAAEDAEKLDYLMNTEKRYVDIGLGFQEDDKGTLIPSSAFDSALNGLTFIGYGVDEDGDPKNIYSLVQRMTDIASKVEKGTDWTRADYDEFDRLVGKLETAASEFKISYTNFDAGTTKLKNNLALLEDNFYNIQEQYADLEDVDMADAITSFVWAQYCYNAALKVGNSVLSESLMDYLN